MPYNFTRILEESYKQETHRLGRTLPALMPDEYRLTPDMERSISNGTYQARAELYSSGVRTTCSSLYSLAQSGFFGSKASARAPQPT